MLICMAEWVSGDVTVSAQWDLGLTNDVIYHKVSRQEPRIFSEFNDRAEWGSFVSYQGLSF